MLILTAQSWKRQKPLASSPISGETDTTGVSAKLKLIGSLDRFLFKASLTPFSLQEDQNQDSKQQQNRGQILHPKDIREHC